MATLGKFELVREIGHGGMSTVYEARDAAIGRRVALKVLTMPPYLSERERETLIGRLNREARAAGRLNHPNIVTVYDIGQQGGHHFIAMELLDGVSLRDRLDAGPMHPDEAARILSQLAEALDAAHANGVLHRDIKPSNAMLLPSGCVKLTDFSVARAMDDATMTHAGATIGSPAYLAPEQVRGERASEATDHWSLGVLLYEMLAGRPPFRGEHIAAVLHQVAYDPAPPLENVPAEVRAVLDRALSKAPEDRYPSARALAAAFEDAVNPVPEPTPRPRRQEVAAGVKGGSATAVSPAPPRRRTWAWAIPVVLLAATLPFLAAQRRPVAPVRPVARKVSLPPPQPPARHGTAAERPAPEGKPRTAPVARRASEGRPPTSSVRVVERPQPATAAVSRPSSGPRTSSGRRLAQKSTSRTAGTRRLASASTSRTSPPRRTVRTVVRRKPAPIRVVSAAAPKVRPAARPVRRAVRKPANTVVARKSTQSPNRRTTLARSPITRPAVVTSKRARTSSGNAVALNNRAYRMQRQGNHRAAEPLLREAIRRNPNLAYAQYNLGWSLVSQGKAREAIGPLRRTAAQQPRRWEPQLRLAQAYEQLGDSEKARAAYARARALRR